MRGCPSSRVPIGPAFRSERGDLALAGGRTPLRTVGRLPVYVLCGLRIVEVRTTLAGEGLQHGRSASSRSSWAELSRGPADTHGSLEEEDLRCHDSDAGRMQLLCRKLRPLLDRKKLPLQEES